MVIKKQEDRSNGIGSAALSALHSTASFINYSFIFVLPGILNGYDDSYGIQNHAAEHRIRGQQLDRVVAFYKKVSRVFSLLQGLFHVLGPRMDTG